MRSQSSKIDGGGGCFSGDIYKHIQCIYKTVLGTLSVTQTLVDYVPGTKV